MHHLFSSLSGNPTWGVIAMFLFLTVFLGIVIVVWKMTPEHRREMKNLPFDEGTQDQA